MRYLGHYYESSSATNQDHIQEPRWIAPNDRAQNQTQCTRGMSLTGVRYVQPPENCYTRALGYHRL